MEGLANVFRKHPEILIISDEIYEYINYVGKHESIAQFSDIKSNVILVNGLSKGFAMTGWRLGYIAADPAIIKGSEKLQGQFTSGTSSITQRAAIVALTGDLQASFHMVEQFTLRRKRILELLSQIPNIKCSEPEGAFYVFPKVDKYFGKKDGDNVIANADDLCMYLLNTAHVSTVTGSAFGEPTCIRMSFANSMQNIEKAMQRVKDALAKLK